MNYSFAKNTCIKHQIVGMILLLCLALSASLHDHSAHFGEQSLIEQLDCKMCQLQLDTPKQTTNLAYVTVGQYLAEKTLSNATQTLSAWHLNLWQRAPPSTC